MFSSIFLKRTCAHALSSMRTFDVPCFEDSQGSYREIDEYDDAETLPIRSCKHVDKMISSARWWQP